jgi:hypothetical protein
VQSAEGGGIWGRDWAESSLGENTFARPHGRRYLGRRIAWIMSPTKDPNHTLPGPRFGMPFSPEKRHSSQIADSKVLSRLKQIMPGLHPSCEGFVFLVALLYYVPRVRITNKLLLLAPAYFCKRSNTHSLTRCAPRYRQLSSRLRIVAYGPQHGWGGGL